MNAISCRTRITAGRVVHFVATGSGLTIASLFFLAPAASATPMKICDLEQGPNGPQCVQQPKQAELCDLEIGPNGLQCVQQPKQVDLCELEQGPKGLQCVEDKIDDKAPVPDPQPPADPEPQPQPELEADQAPDPKGAPVPQPADPQPEAPTSAGAEVGGVPEFEIAASPGTRQPAGQFFSGWIAVALVASGLILLIARRRRQVEDDAAAALERM